MTFLFEILLLSRNLFGYKYDSNYIIESEDSNVYVFKANQFVDKFIDCYLKNVIVDIT